MPSASSSCRPSVVGRSLSLSLARLPSFAEPIPPPSLPDLPCFRLLLLARVSSNGAVHPSWLPSSLVYASMDVNKELVNQSVRT